MTEIFISLGSNLDDRQGNIRNALNLMTAFIKLENLSSLYESEPLGYGQQGWFINSVISGKFSKDPLELLRLCKDVETRMGRIPKYDKGPRIIDIDIITFEKLVINTPELAIPHPAMTERKFVLLPLKEITPDFIHPALEKHIDNLILECPDKSVVRKIGHLWRKEIDGIPNEFS
jgi:2-amino-4-hydroxy-6-hydroxymethyldihydropteridine diphosphokinase